MATTPTPASHSSADPADTLHLARWTVTSGSNANSRGAVVIAAGDHQWEAERSGACEGLRRTSDAEPHRQALLMRSGENALPGECRAEAPLPREVGLLAKLEEELKFLRKKIVVVLHPKAEQWIGLTEGAAANDNLGTPLRD